MHTSPSFDFPACLVRGGVPYLSLVMEVLESLQRLLQNVCDALLLHTIPFSLRGDAIRATRLCQADRGCHRNPKLGGQRLHEKNAHGQQWHATHFSMAFSQLQDWSCTRVTSFLATFITCRHDPLLMNSITSHSSFSCTKDA